MNDRLQGEQWYSHLSHVPVSLKGRSMQAGKLLWWCAFTVVLTCVGGGLAACSLFAYDDEIPAYGRTDELLVGLPLREAKQVTVRVRNFGCNAVSVGSGVIAAPDLLLTNAHVIAGAEEVEITLWDGETFAASVLDATVTEDLALVRVEGDLTGGGRAAIARFAISDPLDGTFLFVVGYPGGGRLRKSTGSLLEYREVDGVRSLVMSNEVAPGNSGGPVFDENARVVGIVRALLESGQGLAIPVGIVDEVQRRLVEEPGTAQIPSCKDFAR